MSRFEERLLFALILALAVLVVGIGLAAGDTHPTVHPAFAGMTQGGDGAARHDDITLLLGWAFGAVTIALFAALMAFGARRNRYAGSLRRFLLLGVLAHLTVWTALVWLYRGYRAGLHDPSPQLFLAFPAPTAVMLYLMLPVPVVFVLYFVLGFRRWVLTPEDQAAYERLLEARDKPEGEE
jgi:hypothetical protein